MTAPPLFSVIVPAHNAADTLAQTVDSVLAQSLPDWELLIYDDASTDGTAEILRGYDADPRITVLRGAENRGAGVARAALLARARGRYAAFLDSDDLWLPERLERVARELERMQADILCTDMRRIDSRGRPAERKRPARRLTRWTHLARNPFLTSASCVRLDLAGAREMPDLRARQDYAYWLGLIRRNPGLRYRYLPEALTLYRRRRGSLSSSPGRNLVNNYRAFRVSGYGPGLSAVALGPHVAARAWRFATGALAQAGSRLAGRNRP